MTTKISDNNEGDGAALTTAASGMASCIQKGEAGPSPAKGSCQASRSKRAAARSARVWTRIGNACPPGSVAVL